MRKTKKHKVYSIEEKNQIVLLYLDKHIGVTQLIREYDLGSDSVLYHWIKQYRENGTVVDGRGKQQRKIIQIRVDPKLLLISHLKK